MSATATATQAGIERMMAVSGITPGMHAKAKHFASDVDAAVEACCAEYLDHLAGGVAGMKDIVGEHRERIVASENAHIGLLFGEGASEAYVASLNGAVREPFAPALGSRVRLGTIVRMLDSLFAAAGREHRFSGPRTAEACLAMAKLLMADALAVTVCHQKAAAAALASHRAELEQRSKDFRQEVVDITERVLASVAGLQEQSAKSLENSRMAGERSESAHKAARECASIVAATADLSGAFAAALSTVDEEASFSEDTSADAVRRAGDVSKTIVDLAAAAERIGSVVDLITRIASQTNLLALNATIEAARAGEVGRGFAVVAGEVKALSQQTTQAAIEIGDQVESIQRAAAVSVSQVEAIAETIGRLAEVGQSVRRTAQEQVAASATMAAQSEMASVRSQEGLRAVLETQAAMHGAMRVITDVDAAVSSVAHAVKDVRAASGRFVVDLGGLKSRPA